MKLSKYFQESADIKMLFIESNKEVMIKTVEKILECLKTGNKLLICGNGGSAADAQHFTAELVGRYKVKRNPLPAIALSTDTSILTAVGNDYGMDDIFSRQVQGLGKEGDVLVGISTSGNSSNIIEAVKMAKSKGIKTIGLLGKSGGKLKDMMNISLVVPSDNTPRIQETHQVIYHTICEFIDKKYEK